MAANILSWNINGLRSSKIDLRELLDNLDAEIICLQETKITRDMLEEPLAIVEGYTSYFSFSRKRSGYSGVVTYCKQRAQPFAAQEGLSGVHGSALLNGAGDQKSLSASWNLEDLKDLDNEGRAIITQHKFKNAEGEHHIVTVINVYCPRADPEKPEREVYKLKFYELLRQRVAVIRESGSHVVIVGDINTSHRKIDHCDPEDSELKSGKEFDNRPGRIFLDSFLISPGDETTSVHSNTKTPFVLEDFTVENMDNYGPPQYTDFQVVDTFRNFYPKKEEMFTCWNVFTNARSNNYGTRIDYIFVDIAFIFSVKDSLIQNDVMGSDHCPVKIVCDIDFIPSDKIPKICSDNFPEFCGKQTKLSSFFNKGKPEVQTKIGLITANKRKVESASCNKNNKKQAKLTNFFSSCGKKDEKKSVNPKGSEQMNTCNEYKIMKENEIDQSGFKITVSEESKKNWSFLMKAPGPPPMCPGHKEPCALRTVRKKGPNFNKQFYACPRGAGKEGDPNSQCNFFKWYTK